MLSGDLLVVVAELAVAIAGFSSVVVALDSRAVREWSPARRYNLRVLLQMSALAVLFALLALFLERATEGVAFWKWALGAYGIAHLIDAGSFIRRQPADIPAVNRLARTSASSSLLASVWLPSWPACTRPRPSTWRV